MLNITRRIGQSVILTTPDGLQIEVTVLPTLHGGDAQLGFSAPREVHIKRSELDQYPLAEHRNKCVI